jgi:hypothetical protein
VLAQATSTTIDAAGPNSGLGAAVPIAVLVIFAAGIVFLAFMTVRLRNIARNDRR